MAFASNSDRLELINSNSAFGLEFVVRVEKNGRQSELTADDIDHALDLQGTWVKNHQADYVEIFRVLPDGTLNPTIGAYRREEVL